jgi:hypothetical protein
MITQVQKMIIMNKKIIKNRKRRHNIFAKKYKATISIERYRKRYGRGIKKINTPLLKYYYEQQPIFLNDSNIEGTGCK